MKPAKQRQKRPRGYRKAGFHRLIAALSQGGLSALDGRSAASKAITRWKAEVAADLAYDLSTAERTLLEVAAGDVALLTVADAWLRENSSQVINRRRKTFVPLVTERLRVAAHLKEVLVTLGLKRQAKPVPQLSEYLADRATPGARVPEGVADAERQQP